MADVTVTVVDQRVVVSIPGTEAIAPLVQSTVDEYIGAAVATANAAAAAAQTAAAAASALAGVTATFETKALATAGIGGVAANAFVMVFEDESQDGHRIVYQKVSGSYVLVTDLNMVPGLVAPGDVVHMGGGEQVSACAAPVSAVDHAAGAMGAGTYRYAVYEHHNGKTSLDNYTSVTIGANRKVMVTLDTIRAGATSRVLCRTKSGGTTYYELFSFGGDHGWHQNKYLDNTPDASLTTLVADPTINSSHSYRFTAYPTVSYMRVNPDLMSDHNDLTVLNANGDTTGLGIDTYAPIYARARSAVNYRGLKVGQRDLNDSYFVSFFMADDLGLGEAGTTLEKVFGISAEGWLSLGRGAIDPLCLIDLWNPVAQTSFTGVDPSSVYLRGVSAVGNYACIDFGTGQDPVAAPAKGRVGVLHGADGAYLVFGTSLSYASGITNERVKIDFNGSLGINAGTSYGAIGYPGELTIKGDGTLLLAAMLNSSGHMKGRWSADGTSLEIFNTGESTPLNYERGYMRWSGNVFEVANDKAGTGATRNFRLGSSGAFIISPGLSDKWLFSGGNLTVLGGDNVQEIGAAAGRLANIYATKLRPGAGGVTWTSGSGTPEGAVTAIVGSLFTRTDGGAATTLYVKESGSGNTGWVAK